MMRRPVVDAEVAGEPTTSSLRLPPLEPPPQLIPWVPAAAAVSGVVLIGLGLLHLVDAAAATMIRVEAVGLLLVAAVCLLGWRSNQRRRELAALVGVVSQLLRAQVIIVRRPRWRGLLVGRVVRLRLRYTDLAAAVYGSQLGWKVAQALEHHTGHAFAVRRQNERRRELLLAEKPVVPEQQLSDLDKQLRRVDAVVAESFGADASLSAVKATDTLVTEFTVHYRSSARALTVAAVRRRTSLAVAERLTGMWKAQFALEGDTVTFKRRPPLPTYVPRPDGPVPEPDTDAYSLIPQGVDEDGQVVYWDISGVMAHFLRAGRTRTGKTVTIVGDAIECARREIPVFVIDPKRVEFMGLRGWPNVQFVATTVHQQIALVYWMYREMEERYRKVEEEGFPDSEFEHLLLIIDEYRQFYGNVRAWWKSIKIAGMPAECPVFEWLGSLLRMAAYCRMHVDLATQRPDAEFLAGEIRDNFSARAATGRLSPDGAEMMFDTVHVGVNVPLNVRGRGTIVGVDDQPKEIQFYYTPDPRRPRNDEDRALLERLRPATARWPALALNLPAPDTFMDEIPAGKKTNLEWEQLLRASFDPITPDTDETLAADDEPTLHDVDGESGAGAQEEEPAIDLDEAYQQPCPVPAGMVSIGDLLSLDDLHGWVTVTDLVRDAASAGQSEVQFEWRSDDGEVGDLILGRGELLEIRRLKS